MSDKFKDFLVCLAVGVVITVPVSFLSAGRGYPFLHSLCDGFFVAAALLLGVGGLRAIRNRGGFDVAGYGISSVVRTTFPFLRGDLDEDIIEYRQRKTEKRKGAWGLFAAGAVYLTLSVIVLFLYYM